MLVPSNDFMEKVRAQRRQIMLLMSPGNRWQVGQEPTDLRRVDSPPSSHSHRWGKFPSARLTSQPEPKAALVGGGSSPLTLRPAHSIPGLQPARPRSPFEVGP